MGKVTLRTVAERAGVSAAVVSAAISGSSSVRMSAATRQRVEEAIRETGYRTNHAAKALKTARTGIVSAIVPKLGNPVYDQMFHGIQDAADADRGVVLLTDADRIRPGSNLMSRLVGTGMADGFLVRFLDLAGETVDEFARHGVPCVVLNGPTDGLHVCVWVDDLQGIFAATAHLLDAGHRRIAMVGGPPQPFTTDTRGDGFRQAFTARGLVPPADDAIFPGYRPDEVRATVTALMSSSLPPTAIVVDNVVIAQGVLATLVDLGVRVPQDLSVIAYHDTEQAVLYRPALTTVRMPLYEAGLRGYATLTRMIKGQKGTSAVVKRPGPKVIDRHSTAPIR